MRKFFTSSAVTTAQLHSAQPELLRRVGDLRWWGSPPGNKAKRFSLVNHTTKTIHHHHLHHHHQPWSVKILGKCRGFGNFGWLVGLYEYHKRNPCILESFSINSFSNDWKIRVAYLFKTLYCKDLHWRSSYQIL